MYRSIRCVRTGRPPLAFRCVIACVYPLGRPLEHQGRKTWIPVIRTFIAASAERNRMNVLRKSYTLSAVSTRMRLGHNLDARSTEVIKSDISHVFSRCVNGYQSRSELGAHPNESIRWHRSLLKDPFRRFTSAKMFNRYKSCRDELLREDA